jgi:REP element-mobilizing transposase RayT
VWLRWEQSVIYFVTICVAHRKPVVANEDAFVAFKNAAAKLRDWTVLAAILMPDHLHVIAAPTKDREAKVGNFSAAIKRWMRQEMQRDASEALALQRRHCRNGAGNRGVLIDCFAPTNRCATNGCMSKKIRFVSAS